MVDKKHYIKLTGFTRQKRGDFGNSWIISYNKKQNCFICEKRSNNKTTKMKNVENFIRIWNHDMHLGLINTPDYELYTCKAYITIFIDNDFYSGFTIHSGASVPVEMIRKYIYLLKDIIEEEDKDSKNVHKDDKKTAEDKDDKKTAEDKDDKKTAEDKDDKKNAEDKDSKKANEDDKNVIITD